MTAVNRAAFHSSCRDHLPVPVGPNRSRAQRPLSRPRPASRSRSRAVSASLLAAEPKVTGPVAAAYDECRRSKSGNSASSSGTSHDLARDLLFGLLALEARLIDFDQLVEACKLCADPAGYPL